MQKLQQQKFIFISNFLLSKYSIETYFIRFFYQLVIVIKFFLLFAFLARMYAHKVIHPIAQHNTDLPMSLIDLNVDCILKIFRFLSLADVVLVSEVCQLFQDLAIQTFKSEWKTKIIRLSNESKCSKLESTAILRNFGSQLQKVLIVFHKHRNDTFFNMIIDKCSSQLTQVVFSSTCVNVEPEKILNKNNMLRFNAKFVNLTSLRFGNNTDDLTEPKCIEQPFPALQELSLFGYPFKNRNIQHFVKSNLQIKSLSALHCNNVTDAKKLIRFIDQQLPFLEMLGLWIHGYADEIGHQPRFLKSLKRLHIHNYGNAANLQHLSISGESVEEMELELGSCDDIYIDFVCQYKNLSKLRIGLYPDSLFDCKFLRKLSTHLPKLSVIEIGGFCKNFNHTDIAHFVNGLKKLLKFTIRGVQSADIFDDLSKIQKKLHSAQWNVVYNSSQRQLNLVR